MSLVFGIRSVCYTDPAGFEPAIYGLEALNSQNRSGETNTGHLPLKEYYYRHKKEFIEWLGKPHKSEGRRRAGISLRTIKEYISAIERLCPEDVFYPKELEEIDFESVCKQLALGLRNLLNFLYDRYEMDQLNGYSIKRWKENLPIKQTNIVEIYITNSELVEAYNNCPNNLKTLFKLLTYSGGRLAQIYRALKDFHPENIVIRGKIARYPISYLSEGTKKGFWLYFPTHFVEEIKDYKLPYVYENLSKRIIHGRVSAKIIRKWHMNFLVVDHEIEEAAVNFIQGRSPATVGSAHYLNKTKKADKEYKKVIDSFPI